MNKHILEDAAFPLGNKVTEARRVLRRFLQSMQHCSHASPERQGGGAVRGPCSLAAYSMPGVSGEVLDACTDSRVMCHEEWGKLGGMGVEARGRPHGGPLILGWKSTKATPHFFLGLSMYVPFVFLPRLTTSRPLLSGHLSSSPTLPSPDPVPVSIGRYGAQPTTCVADSLNNHMSITALGAAKCSVATTLLRTQQVFNIC